MTTCSRNRFLWTLLHAQEQELFFSLSLSWNFQLNSFWNKTQFCSFIEYCTVIVLASFIKYITYKLYSPLSRFKVSFVDTCEYIKKITISSDFQMKSNNEQKEEWCHRENGTFQCFSAHAQLSFKETPPPGYEHQTHARKKKKVEKYNANGKSRG